MSEDTNADNSTIYLDYESYDFEVTPWEILDPKTFAVDAPDDDDKLSFFEQYINYKIKFYAYLNFFTHDPFISGVHKNFQTDYSRTISDLTTKMTDAREKIF
ncbi:hypothetical protein [Flavobacterium sp. 3HN19-14]|uniref:hypothetical protein n=1 Tax=Flavobacterium sp. 3HN19-14 TaxID=3448133 RepID=UPI003EDFA624